MTAAGPPEVPGDDPAGCDITITRVDSRFRRCTVELDGDLLGALGRRGRGAGLGVNVAAGRHTLRVVSGRLTSAALDLDLLPGQAVTVTVDRSPDRQELWTLTARHPS